MALSLGIFLALEPSTTEVFTIENAVLSPTFGLAEIKTEIIAIESAVNTIDSIIMEAPRTPAVPTEAIVEVRTTVTIILITQ